MQARRRLSKAAFSLPLRRRHVPVIAFTSDE
jgi:hypothetical protein